MKLFDTTGTFRLMCSELQANDQWNTAMSELIIYSQQKNTVLQM